jgi:hypothetical protein
VRNGKVWRDYAGHMPQAGDTAQVQIALQRVGESDKYVARVTPQKGVAH